MAIKTKNYQAIIDVSSNRLERIADQRAATETDPNLKTDARRAALDALDRQAADLALEIDEARTMLEAAERRKAGADQAERGHILAAAAALPNSGEKRTASRVEVRHNEPLPEGGAFADLTDKPATVREFGQYMRGLVYGESRAAGEGSNPAGGFLVAPRYAANVLDLMRTKTQVLNAGATVVPLDSNDVTIAKVISDPDPAWRNEHQAIANGDITFGAVNFKAKSLAVLVKASFELIEDAENFGDVLATSLAGAFAVKVDHAALYGSGVDPQPLGMANWAVQTGAYPVGGLTNWDPLVGAVQDVRTANFNPNAAIMSEADMAALSTIKDTNGQYVTAPSYLDGVARLSSGNVTTGNIFVGDWPNLFVGVRTQFEVKVLTERFAENGEVGFIGWLRADIQPGQERAFSVIRPAAG